MLVSLVLFSVMTALMYVNAMRINLKYGVSDIEINAMIFLLGTNSIQIFASLPFQVILTYLVPYNVEASTMALISGFFIWSYEVGAKISASVYCQIFEVDDDHMDNYPKMLYAKLPVICVIMLLVLFLPCNQDIRYLADYLRAKHIRRRDRVTAKLTGKRPSSFDDNEGGSIV